MLGAKRPSGETRATKDFLNTAAPRAKTATMVNIQLANHALSGDDAVFSQQVARIGGRDHKSEYRKHFQPTATNFHNQPPFCIPAANEVSVAD